MEGLNKRNPFPTLSGKGSDNNSRAKSWDYTLCVKMCRGRASTGDCGGSEVGLRLIQIQVRQLSGAVIRLVQFAYEPSIVGQLPGIPEGERGDWAAFP
jgi:hypothetical protein